MSTGPDLRGWAGDGLPSLEQLKRGYNRIKPTEVQLLSGSFLAGDDLAALRGQVLWAGDSDRLWRAVELLRGCDGC